MTASSTVAAAQAALVDLLLDPEALAGWHADPGAWSRARVRSAGTAEMLEGLRPAAVATAAHHMETKGAADRARAERVAQARAEQAAADRARGRRVAAVPYASSVRPPSAPPAVLPAVGCGFRRPLVDALIADIDLVEVWEHIAEWYLDAGSRGERQLARFASADPIALHCVALSLGSVDCLDDVERIDGVGRLAAAAGVNHVADHLGFCRVNGRALPHFFPLWRTAEQLEVVVANVAAIQERWGRRLIVENPAMMVDPGGDYSTAEFLNELSRRTGCGVLLDLENLRVNDANGYLDADAELATLDRATVVEIHVAGGAPPEPGDALSIDTHDHRVHDSVLARLGELLPDLPNCRHVLIERDDRFEEAFEVRDDLVRIHETVDPLRRREPALVRP